MKQHPHRPDIYVTEDGRVFRELYPSVDGKGYSQIRNGDLRERRHTLVCETYHGPRPQGQVVRHKDGTTDNDHPDNLEWGTPLENVQDAMKHGVHPKGQTLGHAKLTDEQALEIRKRRSAGERGRTLALEFNVSEQTVCDIHAGRSWSHL